MRTFLKLIPAPACLIAVAGLLGAPHTAQAQGLTFAVTGPGTIIAPGILNDNNGTVTVSGAPGDTLTFVGSLTNNTASDLTNLSITSSGDDPALNLTPSALNDLSLGTSENGDLFTITLPSAPSTTLYSFSVGVSGLDDTQSPVSSDDSYTINATVTPAPEPSGLIVLATGVLSTTVLKLRRRNASEA